MSMLNRLSTLGGVDPLPTALGPAIKSPAASPVASEPKRIAPGLMRGPDGKLYTDLPVPPTLAPQQPEPPLNAPGAGEVFFLTNPTAGVRPSSGNSSASQAAIAAAVRIRARHGETWAPDSGVQGLRPGDRLFVDELLAVQDFLPDLKLQVVAQPPAGENSVPFRLYLALKRGESCPKELLEDGLVLPEDGTYSYSDISSGFVQRIA